MSKSKGFKEVKFSLTYLQDSDQHCGIDTCAFMAQVFVAGIIHNWYLCRSHLAQVLSDYDTFELIEEDASYEAWAKWKQKKFEEGLEV